MNPIEFFDPESDSPLTIPELKSSMLEYCSRKETENKIFRDIASSGMLDEMEADRYCTERSDTYCARFAENRDYPADILSHCVRMSAIAVTWMRANAQVIKRK